MSGTPDQDEGPRLSADPLHSTKGFAWRHLVQLVLIVVALAALVVVNGYIDCGG